MMCLSKTECILFLCFLKVFTIIEVCHIWVWISKIPKLFYTFMPKIPKKVEKSFFPKKLGKGAHEPYLEFEVLSLATCLQDF